MIRPVLRFGVAFFFAVLSSAALLPDLVWTAARIRDPTSFAGERAETAWLLEMEEILQPSFDCRIKD